jgi:hypothetical protein
LTRLQASLGGLCASSSRAVKKPFPRSSRLQHFADSSVVSHRVALAAVPERGEIC